MTTLVVGASGATGRLLVEELVNRGENIKVIIRALDRIPESIRRHQNVSVIEASVLDLSADELSRHVKECGAVASCLGHNLSFKGMYGQPRRLVTETTKRLCAAIRSNNAAQAVKFVLMNTTGNSNRDLQEQISFGQKLVIGALRLLLPPHVDNEEAADFLRTGIGQRDNEIEWVAVRPDNLSDEDVVTGYDVCPSPTRSAIFDSGSTSRINVGHFMADLITEDDIWNKWQGQMPVIYNNE